MRMTTCEVGKPETFGNWRPSSKTPAGFTLLELLVVIAIIAIVAAMLFPAISAAKQRANAALCLSRKMQLQLGWSVYATDHGDRIVPNGEVDGRGASKEFKYWWVQGVMDYSGGNTDNTNTTLLLSSDYARLAEYVPAAEPYKCPEDKSRVLIAGRTHSRVRSVSMNVHVGRCVDCFGEGPATHIGPQNVAAIPSPSKQFIFIDEHPDSVNTTAFWLSSVRAGSSKFLSVPGSSHQGKGVLSFADGHTEVHRWTDDRTKLPVTGEKMTDELKSPNNSDVEWLQERTHFP